MRVTKNLISIALPICVLANSIPTMAATSYTTTNADFENIETPITNDKDDNKVDVNVTQASTFSVTIPKKIILDGSADKANEATYTINVSGNIASNEAIIVEPDTTFTMSDVKKVKDDLEGTISQTITKFVDKEINIDSTLTNFQHIGDTTGKVSINNLTSGEWAGSFNFNIKLHTHNFNETIESEATFSNEGSSKYSCEECGFFANKTIPIKQAKTCFGDYTWDEIQEICKNGLAKEYFGEYIGQEKTIALGSMDTMAYVYTGSPNNDISILDSQTATIALADIADDGTSVTCIFTSYEKQTPYYYMNLNDTNEDS